MRAQGVDFLDTPETYFDVIDQRVPNHGEDVARLARNKILIDADPETHQRKLLQIFTQNCIGPIFFEIIQRKGNEGFGEASPRCLKASSATRIAHGHCLSNNCPLANLGEFPPASPPAATGPASAQVPPRPSPARCRSGRTPTEGGPRPVRRLTGTAFTAPRRQQSPQLAWPGSARP